MLIIKSGNDANVLLCVAVRWGAENIKKTPVNLPIEGVLAGVLLCSYLWRRFAGSSSPVVIYDGIAGWL